MQHNPIALIEFVVFMGFVIWLFTWQFSSAKRHGKQGPQARGDNDPADTGADLRSGQVVRNDSDRVQDDRLEEER